MKQDLQTNLPAYQEMMDWILRDADFLYDTIGVYIRDAQKANRSDLVDMWNTIKQDRQDICRC